MIFISFHLRIVLKGMIPYYPIRIFNYISVKLNRTMMKKSAPLPFFFLVFLLSVQVVLAHPGHGNQEVDGYSILHFLSESLHLISIGVLAIAIYVIVKLVGKVRRQRSS